MRMVKDLNLALDRLSQWENTENVGSRRGGGRCLAAGLSAPAAAQIRVVLKLVTGLGCDVRGRARRKGSGMDTPIVELGHFIQAINSGYRDQFGYRRIGDMVEADARGLTSIFKIPQTRAHGRCEGQRHGDTLLLEPPPVGGTDSAGKGRFWMGLPNSSVSQRRLEVYLEGPCSVVVI
jgi:hypothetical protein